MKLACPFLGFENRHNSLPGCRKLELPQYREEKVAVKKKKTPPPPLLPSPRIRDGKSVKTPSSAANTQQDPKGEKEVNLPVYDKKPEEEKASAQSFS